MTPAIPEELSSERQQSSEPAAEASSAEGKLLAQPAKLTKANALHALGRANTAKKHELLFEAWDTNGDGIVDFPELALGIRKLQPSPEDVHLEYVAEATTAALVEFDTHANQSLDREDFKLFVERLTQEMGKPFSIVSELLILSALEVQPLKKSDSAIFQEIQGKAEEQVKQAQRITTLSQDVRVVRLFQCFNRSGSGQISFSELCRMLHKLRRDISLREARAQAVNALLLCDRESQRALNRVEFARFLQRLGVLLHLEAGSLAEQLLVIAERGEDLPSLNDSATAFSMDTRDAVAQVYETLADRKLHLLFELWDKDGDGSISFAELALGLRKFSSPAEPCTETAADAAETLLLFDADSDQKLDRAEFARFVNNFCEACGTDFNTLSEFLILLATLEDNPSEELAFLLSEDKVGRAVSDLDATWRLGINPNPFAKTAAEAKSEAKSAASSPPQPVDSTAKPKSAA